jgi:muramidase (phage lysozyme)
MALQYSLYGGATRPDAISGLNPRLAAALERLYAEAPPEVQRELGLNSAYRSKEVQQALWDKSDKTGRTVAAPGKSRHNSGEAVDLFGFGLKGGGQVSQATKDWVGANLGKYGLVRPMDYEPWHLQLADAGKAPQQGPQAGWTPEQIQKAFLDTIAGPESGGAYDIMYGGNKFTDFSRHPHTPQTAGGITSDVAGRYQFKGSTWDELQGKYGYKDFSQANQDAAAWQYARDIYKQKSGGDLVEALQSGDPARINAASQVLNQTWTSLPGGKEQDLLRCLFRPPWPGWRCACDRYQRRRSYRCRRYRQSVRAAADREGAAEKLPAKVRRKYSGRCRRPRCAAAPGGHAAAARRGDHRR